MLYILTILLFVISLLFKKINLFLPLFSFAVEAVSLFYYFQLFYFSTKNVLKTLFFSTAQIF